MRLQAQQLCEATVACAQAWTNQESVHVRGNVAWIERTVHEVLNECRLNTRLVVRHPAGQAKPGLTAGLHLGNRTKQKTDITAGELDIFIVMLARLRLHVRGLQHRDSGIQHVFMQRRETLTCELHIHLYIAQ